MFQSTSVSWTYCCVLPKTHKADWDSLPSVSESVKAARLPRLPALHCPWKKWRLASQADPHDCLQDDEDAGTG